MAGNLGKYPVDVVNVQDDVGEDGHGVTALSQSVSYVWPLFIDLWGVLSSVDEYHVHVVDLNFVLLKSPVDSGTGSKVNPATNAYYIVK